MPAGNNLIVYNDWNTSAGLVVSYVTKDHLGSSYNISDKNGNSVLMNGTSVVNEHYSAMGWEELGGLEGTIATVSRHQFTGQEDLYNVGLMNMNGRVYNPSGLYMLSPDPHVPHPTDTRSYNRYAYAEYNPLTLVDPTGFDDKACGLAGCGGNSCYGNCGNGQWANSLPEANPTYDAAVNYLANAAIDASQSDLNAPLSSVVSDLFGSNGPADEAQAGEQGQAGGGTSGISESTATVDALQTVTVSGSSLANAAVSSGSIDNLPTIVVTTYRGAFHDQVVSALTMSMRKMGWQVSNNVKLCMVGGGPCAIPDIFGSARGVLFIIEVKTGENPPFSPEQLAVYAHLDAAGVLSSPWPDITDFGYSLNQPLPPISGWSYYQQDANTPPEVKPLNVPFVKSD